MFKELTSWNPQELVKPSLILRFIPLFLIFAFAGGCKIHVQSPAGASVATESGSFRCLAEELCEVDVSNAYFNEIFIAQADPGFYFMGWKQGERLLCGGASEPCPISTIGFDAYDALMGLLQSDSEVFYLEPRIVPENQVLDVSGYEMSAGKEDAYLVLDTTLPDKEVLILPYYLEGREVGASMVATFNGNTLESLSNVLEGLTVDFLTFDIKDYRGKKGKLKLTLSSQGNASTRVLVIKEAKLPTDG